MLTQLIASFSDNFKQKTRNPFFGTLILIWIAKNWKLVYALFYFDSTYTLDKRISYIENYYKDTSFFWNLMVCVGLALVSLIVSYFFLHLSRLLVNFYEDIISPWVSKITNKSSIVLKIKYQELEKEKERLEKKFSTEKEKRIGAEKEVDILEKDSIEKAKDILQKETEINDLNKQLEGLTNRLNAQSNKNQEIKTVSSPPKKGRSQILYEKIIKSSEFNHAFKRLIIANSKKGFIATSDISASYESPNQILKGQTFYDFVLENEILKPINSDAYNFTGLGMEIKSLYQENKEIN